jgi:hypothetical protein
MSSSSSSSTILPKTRIERIAFFETRNAPWSSVAVSIGTTTAAVTTHTANTDAARAAYEAHQLAQAQAKAATQAFYAAVAVMTTSGSDIIKQVKTKAALAGGGLAGAAIYNLALLPVPTPPSPIPAPGTPTDFKISLSQAGALTLKWKCPNPAGGVGTIYQIARRIGATGAFVPLTGVGTRSFTDTTIPAGTASVTYQITAVRTTAVGVPALFIVNFGTGAGGEMVASVVAASAPKLAA